MRQYKLPQTKYGLTTHEDEIVHQLRSAAAEATKLADDIVSGRAAHYDGYAEANTIVMLSLEAARLIHQGFDREWMEKRHSHGGDS